MPDPSNILSEFFSIAISRDYKQIQADPEVLKKIEYICECISNRAGVRLLMACLLAKVHKSNVNPTKPYTEIGSDDCFSGRTYDEKYISRFVADNDLPCNPTTAFLTPALRNINNPLSTDLELIGRPRQVYTDTIALLHCVHNGQIDASELLIEVIRRLTVIRDSKKESLSKKLEELKNHSAEVILSSEETIALIEQHLSCKHSSRLPVLIVAAAYNTARNRIGEQIRSLLSHNAADEQTGSMGDVEVCLINDDNVRTVYEMKMKKVLREDIDRAIQKIAIGGESIDNYIFITTDEVDETIFEYAKNMYEKLGQREIAILDCIGFLRHFLHFFHRLRRRFIDEYQELVIHEPESAVRHELKEVFLHLRQVAETRE
jgi:hypothetical protein